jgi:hypothetical protein
MRGLKTAIIIQLIFICLSFAKSENDKISELAKAVEVLINKLIEKNHGVFDFIEVVENVKDGRLIDLQTEILRQVPRTITLRLDHFLHIQTARMRIRRNIFVYLENIEQFHKFKDGIASNRFDFYGHYIFILYKKFSSDVQVIFNEMWKKYIYNVYAIYENGSEIDLMTFRPFENSANCDDITASVVNKFINGSFVDSQVLIHKLRNFHGCPLRVTTFPDVGNVMKRTHANGTVELYGQSLDFMNAVADSLNFKPVIDLFEGENPWGHVYENGTAVGISGKLWRKEAHIAFGDWNLKASRTKYFDTTLSHGFNHLVFVVPPGEHFTPLEKLLLPFHWVVWVLLLVTILAGLLVIAIINYKLQQMRSFVYGSNVRNPVMNMIIGILGSQQNVLPKRNFARFILMMFLILCLVMRSAYQGALFENLQSEQRHKEVYTLKSLLQNKFTLYTYSIHEDFINASMPGFMKHMKTYSFNSSFLVQRLKEGDKKAGLENLKTIIFASRQNHGQNVFNYCKEIFISANLVWFVNRNSFLIKIINRKIEALICGGFIQHWIRKYYDSADIKDTGKKLQKLSFTQLSGVFHVMVFGYILACLAFVSEMIVKRMMGRRN